ncbi:two-component system response regulator DegU [Evansella vedderi]|uniref:Two-component system response regulator DegU n=1 Tax=Evansella vedderi TaxID=38282 RepID=A0ABT9ZTG7_9BACI|nr:LuxR C-terminal-related transcriptional regulator [Evansella vedderi]MDQ0254533.1 two-component system response regulator DegU [Evansella vedderi]
MLTTETRHTNTHPSILFFDQQDEISERVIESMEHQLKEGSVTKKRTLPEELLSYNCILYFIDSYSRTHGNNIKKLVELVDENKDIYILLVHHNCNERELLRYLTLPVNGIVSIDYLENHLSLVLSLVKDKGVFLEPDLHKNLILEIEKKKLRDQPIKKLILNRELVAPMLTEHEQDVLQLILDGHNNRAIAENLYLAQSTVSSIISNMLKKMQANDRTDAMVKSIRNGWVEACR